MFLVKWNVICFNDAKLRLKNEISNCSTEGEMRKLENERISKWGGLRSSEGNGDFQKEVEGSFDEKRV